MTSQTWEPISINELTEKITLGEKSLYDMGWEEYNDLYIAFWNLVKISPQKWQEAEFWNVGGWFWVVGIFWNKAIYYNDVEEWFNVSTWIDFWIINSYSPEQDELQYAIYKIFNPPKFIRWWAESFPW